MYHSAASFYNLDLEIAYGGSDEDGTGIYINYDRKCIMNFKYLYTIDYGTCRLSADNIKSLINSLRIKYAAKKYNAVTHNCNNFTNDVLKYLTCYAINKKRDFILPE